MGEGKEITPTRRGFLGTLAALAAVPMIGVSKAAAIEPIATLATGNIVRVALCGVSMGHGAIVDIFTKDTNFCRGEKVYATKDGLATKRRTKVVVGYALE